MPPQPDQLPALYNLGRRVFRALQLLVLVILVSGLVYGWRWLSDPREFPIRTVKVEASYQHVDQTALQQEVLPYLKQGFVGLHATDLQQQLLQNPWIAAVVVHRVWPDTVQIKITEQQAIARWNDKALLNAKGEIFTPPPATLPTPLPMLYGPDDKAAVLWEQYQAISHTLAPLNLTVSRLDMDARQAVTVVLDNDLKLILGNTESLPRLQRFVKVYPKIFTSANARADYVDLRYANGVSIKWRANTNDSSPSE